MITLAKRNPVRIAALLVLLAATIGAVFPHAHERAAPLRHGPSGADASHAPHPESCLESAADDGSEAFCAICSFQRLAARGQIATGLHHAVTLPQAPCACAQSVLRAEALSRADRPRGPPAA